VSVPPQTAYGGRYEVIESAGTGGMAEVYRARDQLLGREVAVKVLSRRLAGDRAFVERFRREAQAVANLSHPNIVSLFDFGAEDATYFIVMEFIDGRPLEQVIRDSGPLMPERAAEIAADVAAALERAHAAGLIHRDIKPSNVMITNAGNTKVTDFGIVRALSASEEQTMTQTGMVIGTAAYLSPEQAQGKPLDGRSDVYSLGVVLYEMLTGETPFSGETPLSIAYKHVREHAAVPSSVNPDVPPELDAIVMKAMAKNPENRYATAGEMRADLQRFSSGRPVYATPVLGAEETTVVTPVGGGTEVLTETEYQPEPQEPGKRGALPYVLGALLILALFGGLAYLLANSLLGGEAAGPPRVRVPDVVGDNVNDARDRLEEVRLDPSVKLRPSNAPEDEVINQDPAAGARIRRGGEVLLTVSSGPRQVSVPEITGQSVDEAAATLEDVGLELGEQTQETSDDFEEGTISAQSPSAGSEVDKGSAVDVVVSTGAEVATVPFVEGQSEEEATANIEAAGLIPEVTREPSDEVEEGIVSEQDPPGGTEVSAGDTVTITVSEGPPTQELRDLTGLPADQAAAALEQFGLDVTQQELAEGCGEDPGAVCDQDPSPGTPVSPGDSVTLFVEPATQDQAAGNPGGGPPGQGPGNGQGPPSNGR
jgi:eukaryotic-like serine/threonine-protein kinase